MKKIIFQSFLAFSLMQTAGVNAQLTVKGTSSFVYVGDELLFVNQNVNLDGGNIYLRRQGQLMQGDVVNKPENSRTTEGGNLSAFVMSKATNQYNYTHYGLPVSTTSGVFTPDGNSIGRPSDVISFVAGNLNGDRVNDGLALTGNTIRLNRDFISWYEGNGAYASWKYVKSGGASANIPKGYGLYFKGTAGSDAQTAGESTANKANTNAAQRIEFRGIPNDGNIEVPVTGDMMYSMGNPYPTSFNINDFMDDNASVLEGIYYYVELNKSTHTLPFYKFGYAKYTKANGPDKVVGLFTMPSEFYKPNNDGTLNELADVNGISLPQTYTVDTPFIGIGTGFWVKTKAGIPAGAKVIFKNTHRNYTNDVQKDSTNALARSLSTKNEDYGFFDDVINLKGIDYTKISKAPLPTISIFARTSQDVDVVALVFNDNASENYTHLSDAISDGSDSNFKMYLDGVDHNYRLKTAKFDSNKKYPLAFDSKVEQTLNLSIDNIVNFKDSESIYIFDEYTGIYKDVLKDKVSFTIPSGVTKGRYFITFAKDNANLVDETVVNNAFIVLQNNKDKALTIANPEALNVVSTEIFDIQGRLVLSKRNLGTEPEYRFSTSGFADGIYVVKIATKNGKSVSKKVIVKN